MGKCVGEIRAGVERGLWAGLGDVLSALLSPPERGLGPALWGLWRCPLDPTWSWLFFR
jgi:hypothetical protein